VGEGEEKLSKSVQQQGGHGFRGSKRVHGYRGSLAVQQHRNPYNSPYNSPYSGIEARFSRRKAARFSRNSTAARGLDFLGGWARFFEVANTIFEKGSLLENSVQSV